MQEKNNKSQDDIFGAIGNINGNDSRQEALDKVTEMLEAARAANTRTKKQKKQKNTEPSVRSKELAPFAVPERKLYSQEAVDKVSEMLDSARAANKHNVKKYKPELINISEKADDAAASEPKDDRQIAVDKVTQMISSAVIENEAERKKPKLSDSSTEIVLLEFISFIIFIVTYNSNVPEMIPLIAVFLPVIVGIFSRVFLQQLTLREAVSRCRMHIIITLFFFVCITLSLI